MAKNSDPAVVLSLEKINEIEEIIDSSPAPRFGGNTDRRIIDIDDIYSLIGDLKVTIPEDVRKADSIIADAKNITTKAEKYAAEIGNNAQARADSIVSEAESKRESIVSTAEANASSIVAAAEAKAESIIADAEAKREALLDEHDIIIEAEHRAELLRRKAEYNAQRVYDNAKTYADQILGSLMKFLEEYHGIVEINRNDLGVIPKPDFNNGVVEQDNRPAEVGQAKQNDEYDDEYDDDMDDDEHGDVFFGLFKRKKKKTEEDDEDDE